MTDATDDGFTGGGNAAALLTEESEPAEEAEAPAPLLCQSCRKAALRAHETPDEGYDCDACGAARRARARRQNGEEEEAT